MKDIFKQQFLTQKEVAELFRVSTNTIGNWEKRWFFSRWQAPGSTRVLYLSDEVRDFLDKNLKPRGEGAKPKKINGIKKERPVISSNRKWKV